MDVLLWGLPSLGPNPRRARATASRATNLSKNQLGSKGQDGQYPRSESGDGNTLSELIALLNRECKTENKNKHRSPGPRSAASVTTAVLRCL